MKKGRNAFLLSLSMVFLVFILGCTGAPDPVQQEYAEVKSPPAEAESDAAGGSEAVKEDEPKSETEMFELKIIGTSDLHGSLFPYDFINDRPAATSLAQVSTYVKQQRAVENQEVLLLDNGDMLQGQPIVYYYNFEKTDVPHIQARMMNYLGYAAASVGNHDIETGHPVYDKVVNDFEFPWLGANVIDEESGEPYFQPYAVFDIRGAKVAVLGMITPGVPRWLPEDIWKGFRFEDMIRTAQKWVPLIQEREKPDLLIGLFHSGVDYTYGGASREEECNENASLLVAEEVPGFDIILSGHDHQDTNTTVQGPGGKDVYLIGALNAARTVATATVKFTRDASSGTFEKSISAETVKLENVPADEDFVNAFAGAYEDVKTWVSKPIGTFTKTISTREAMFGDSPFVDLIHRIQLELTGADVSFAAPLSFDAEIREGTVYVRDMFNLYKYENLLYTMEMTGREILGFLEYSCSGWFDTMKQPGDNLIKFQKDEEGKPLWSDRYNSYQQANRYYNYDSAAGVNYMVNVSEPEGRKVKIFSFSNGREFDLDETYTVAINSYRGNGGGNHLTRGAGIPKEELSSRILSSTIQDLRYYLMKWIENQKTVTPAALGNWHVFPTALWQSGKDLDYRLLYEGEKLP